MSVISLDGLNTLIDNLEEGILFLDEERRVLAINKAAMDMFGRNDEHFIDEICPSELVGTTCTQACDQRGYCSLAKTDNDGREMRDIELRRPDSTTLYLRMWAMSLAGSVGRAHCAIVLKNRTLERQLEEEVSERLRLGGLIGHTPPMQELYKQILRAAVSEASVLIEGESGVGKELVSRALHENSNRDKGPYVRVHCAALAENLLESELFGHARGAFTGAETARAGRFEAADGGTLLLDEIGEISPQIQVKLLRVLQEREVERLGENKPRKVDVRIIAATNRDLAAMVRAGKFREDLYYRLRVLPLRVPPLRERREDISLLASHLLSNIVRRGYGGEVRFSPQALQALEAYHWPGNVRELSNVIEYAMVHVNGAEILPHHLPQEVLSTSQAQQAPLGVAPSEIRVDGPKAMSAKPGEPLSLGLTRYYQRPSPEEEKAAIVRALQEAGGNKTAAAERLGMSRTTLWKRLKKYGLLAGQGSAGS
ncbi:MAG TPA: PAS domain-containing protein [Gammaproteobacteria bacterium]|nr:PAS domain-containing protein [Gammaproteobacteria bacterium]